MLSDFNCSVPSIWFMKILYAQIVNKNNWIELASLVYKIILPPNNEERYN